MLEDQEDQEDHPPEIRYLTAEHIEILHEAVLASHEDPTVLDTNLVKSIAVRPQTKHFGEEQFPGRQDSQDGDTHQTSVHLCAADAATKLLISGFASHEPLSVTDPLDRVTDPELRQIMEVVLDEDADLIAYLRNR